MLKSTNLNARFPNSEQQFAIWGVDFSKYYLLRWKRTQAVLPLAARETPPLHPAGGGADYLESNNNITIAEIATITL